MSMGDPSASEPSRYSPPGAADRAPGSPGPDQSNPTWSYPAPGQQYPAPGSPPPSGSAAPPSPGWPRAGQPHPGAYGAPGSQYGGVSADDRNWGIGAHVSSLLGAWIALGFIGPLVVMLVQGPKSPFVRAHAVEALNFNLSVLIYGIVSLVLTFVLIGIPMLFALGILWLVCTILGAVKASQGEHYRYPLTIRMVS